MATLSVKEKTVYSFEEKRHNTQPEEVMAFCPGCKAIETVWLNGDSLMSTRKFNQVGRRIYHNCGSNQPCHLYFNW